MSKLIFSRKVTIMENKYIHGTNKREQERLAGLNEITNNSFIDFLGDLSNKKICDFGCGLGLLIAQIKERYPDVEIVGVEISSEQIKTARENTKEYSNVTLINKDVLNNGLENNIYDVVYCRYLLEHVSEPSIVAKEMVRIAKPGGKVFCQENDLYNGILYPDVDGYSDFRKLLCNLQEKQGGDPYIGRKLYSLFKDLKVNSIKLSYMPEVYTENDALYKSWLNNMLGIMYGVKEQLIADGSISKSQFEKIYNSLKERINNPQGVTYFHWNRIEVTK